MAEEIEPERIDVNALRDRAKFVMQQLADAGIVPDNETMIALCFVVLSQLRARGYMYGIKTSAEIAEKATLMAASEMMSLAAVVIDWNADGPKGHFKVATKN